MGYWFERRPRMDIDELVRSGDTAFNIAVVIMLVVFALGFTAYRFGQMNPDQRTAAMTAPISAPPQNPANPKS